MTLEFDKEKTLRKCIVTTMVNCTYPMIKEGTYYLMPDTLKRKTLRSWHPYARTADRIQWRWMSRGYANNNKEYNVNCRLIGHEYKTRGNCIINR